MQTSKAERERLVFGLFARVAGLVPGGSFTSREPPEPDILYVDAIGARSAFELVEIVDRDYVAMIRRQLATKELCESYLASLPAENREPFRAKYSDADIFLGFPGALSLQQRKNALPEIFEHLMSLPDGFAGETLDDGLHAVECVSVHRSRIVGPMFDAPSFGRVGDPTVAALKHKLTKSYEPQGTLKLLADIDANPMYPEEVGLSDLDEFLKHLDSASQFAEIFVYDCRSSSIKRHWRAT
jgi:hypothetical protein